LIGYAITSKGDLASKLNYAFELYDADNNGFLTSNEVQEVLAGMLDLLGADKKTDVKALTEEVLKQLDSSRDGKVSKDEVNNFLLIENFEKSHLFFIIK
jgi:Ca2+-binding EF-hand superfamily protein